MSKSIYPPVPAHARTLAETVYLTFILTVTVTVGGLVELSTEPDYEQVSLLNFMSIVARIVSKFIPQFVLHSTA